MKNLSNTFKYLLGGLALILVVAFVVNMNQQETRMEVQENVALQKSQKEKLEYSILDQSDYIPQGQKFLILLPESSNREYTTKVANEIVTSHRGDFEEITMYFWDDQRSYDIGTGYNVGVAEWSGNELGFEWFEKSILTGSTQPSNQELEVFDYYWKVFDEKGNPRGYTTHPTVVDEYTNDWEIDRIDRITAKYDISREQLLSIVTKVSDWQFSQ